MADGDRRAAAAHAHAGPGGPAAFDLARLAAFPIPEGRQHLTPFDAQLYALSVGLGQDPTDPGALAYVDEGHGGGLRALPTLASVAAGPGFWLADPAAGVDAVRLVHGGHALALHRPLPTAAALAGRSRVTGVFDRGPGRGALLTTARTLVDTATGAALATIEDQVVLRGDGGYGGPPPPPAGPEPVPDRPPDLAVDLPTRPEQALLYRLNGDRNPLHADPAVAAAAGFARPILHGLCTFAVAGHALLRALCGYDAARFGGMALRFVSPVLPGEGLRVEIWQDGEGARFRVRAGDGRMVADRGRFRHAFAPPATTPEEAAMRASA